MAPIVTVDYMIELLQKIRDAGKGDMKIKCGDDFLHWDEIVIDHMENCMSFRGKLYNLEVTQKIRQFCNDVDMAEKKLYGFISDEEREEI